MLNKAFGHGFYQNWACAQLCLAHLLIQIKPIDFTIHKDSWVSQTHEA